MSMLKKIYSAVVFAVAAIAVVAPVPAQVLDVDAARKSSQVHATYGSSHAHGADDVVPLHITRALIESDRGQQALAAYKSMRDAGQFPLRKGDAQSAQVGQAQIFHVFNLRTSDYIPVDFTLTIEHEAFNLWVETAQLAPNGPVEQSDLDQMALALGTQTPAGSSNPNQGIILNDEQIFGPPPNVDGDGKTDVMLHDIQDFFDPSAGNFSAVLGFFDPSDLSGGSGNTRDMIHIDVMPGMFSSTGERRDQSSVQQTLAHEYQHLIFARVNSGDAAFVDEGLAEWAEVQNGFTARSINYLSSPSERARPFMDFRGTGSDNSQFGGPGGEDYQRAGLFTNYFSERVGVLETGALSRSTGINAGNYVLQLNQLTGNDGLNTLKTYIQGFHVANLINDRSVAENYGHLEDQYAFVRASNIPVVDGTASTSTPPTNRSVRPGGVEYVRWENVSNFTINLVPTGSTNPDHLMPVLVLDPVSGPLQIQDAELGGEGTTVSGDYDAVTLVMPHTDITVGTNQTAGVSYDASWSPLQSQITFQNVTYDSGEIQTEQSGDQTLLVGFSLDDGQLPVTSRFANRFETPVGMRLESISVATYYMSIFGEAQSNVQDFRLRLYTAADGTNPLPGVEVLSLDVSDNTQMEVPQLTFHEIDLTAFEEEIQQLTETFFVSIENTGSDDNHLFVGLSSFTGTDNPGALYFPFSGGSGDFSWGSFNTINDGNGNLIFEGQIVPIQATFSDRAFTITDTDEEAVLPEAVSLKNNWPNPFAHRTTIAYELARPDRVTLAVYDMLGRKVATLVDQAQTAGSHSAVFEPEALSSGVYLYRLETSTATTSRSMLLVR